ncbi:MAG: RNA polymerase factor sigma-32 [Polyangiaceae bacterium]|nr:RNA polymerase factor sigma-32 [Polyangiaceae bacterium]MCB9605103.1 RNA polymerase factor sigma-32 [Polyangiaceae bacterium]
MATQSDPEVSRYITMTQHLPKLSREEEVELALAWRDQGKQSAADKLLAAHLRYVVAIAVKYRRYGLPIGELIAEGNFGLVHALSKFEPERGNRFVTYAAYWIRAYILNYIIRSWSLVGVGSGALRSKMFFKLRRERVKITNLLGEGEAADTALAEKFGVSTTQLRSMMRRLESRDVSLDTKVFDDSGTTMLDTLVSEDTDQESTLAGDEVGQMRREAIGEAMKALDPRERFIVEERLMADPEDELSLAEIGRRLGVSRERARQLEARAKRKLKTQIAELSRNAGKDLLELDSAA